ncbi:hypothetical protein Cantr_00795 [Candida viswanathii]|uniref:Uncharacterized protein n=1 Tax=Candida viswanathii TaxID=5486 RepID=A0A367YGZ7_9ASCO|nr:hypothetical protein Cantr_00795 [Candida viswanathii]
MDHDISDHETPELPLVPVRCLCRGQEWSRLSAPEELTSPLLMDSHLCDAASSELPQFPVWGHCVVDYNQVTNRRCRRNDHLMCLD